MSLFQKYKNLLSWMEHKHLLCLKQVSAGKMPALHGLVIACGAFPQ